jgi:hypothetical protein
MKCEAIFEVLSTKINGMEVNDACVSFSFSL